MQALYACLIRNQYTPAAVEMMLFDVFKDFSVLLLKLTAILPAWVQVGREIVKRNKQKMLPTAEDLNPNLKFVHNRLIQKFSENHHLQKEIRDKKLTWNNDLDRLAAKDIFLQLTKTEYYKTYMEKEEDSFAADKEFLLTIVEGFMMENEDLAAYFGDQKAFWVHDYDYAAVLLHQFLQSLTENNAARTTFPPLFKATGDEEGDDWFFMRRLAAKTIRNDCHYKRLVGEMLYNWEMERLATLDVILIKMAICEFCEFSSIPVKVSMDEYIELSKYYSTPNSRRFINGMLDRILAQLKEDNQIHKQGRGLG
jgi:N utilization substance protein B